MSPNILKAPNRCIFGFLQTQITFQLHSCLQCAVALATTHHVRQPTLATHPPPANFPASIFATQRFHHLASLALAVTFHLERIFYRSILVCHLDPFRRAPTLARSALGSGPHAHLHLLSVRGTLLSKSPTHPEYLY